MQPKTAARPRILLWYWGRRGGGSQFTLGLARALSQHPGVSLSLSLSSYGELTSSFCELGLPIRLFNTYRDIKGFVGGLIRIPGIKRELINDGSGCDVVISTMSHLWTPLVAPALTRAGIPFISVVHDAMPHPGDLTLAWDWRMRHELDAARAVITLSDQVAAAVRHRAPHTPIIRMPLPALLLNASSPKRSTNIGQFLFFGRIREYKGLTLLRDAFKILHLRHPYISLRVVGEGNAEACAPGLAGMPGVSVECRWVPETEIPALLGAASVVVLPYREASQSGIVPQALAMGVPVVATPVGGLVEQVRKGAGGLVASAVTPEAFAEAMEFTLEAVTLESSKERGFSYSSVGDRLVGCSRVLVRWLTTRDA